MKVMKPAETGGWIHVLLCKLVGKYMDTIKKVISLIKRLVLYVLVSFLFHAITDNTPIKQVFDKIKY